MKTRDDGVSATLEAYLEAIQELQKQYGAVRVTDLAEKMKCRLPSVSSALRRLSKLELIRYEAYRPVTLTPAGEAFVRKMSVRHRILADFFRAVLVLPDMEADEEACRLEHRISPVILRRLEHFMTFLRSEEDSEDAIRRQGEAFQKFLDHRL